MGIAVVIILIALMYFKKLYFPSGANEFSKKDSFKAEGGSPEFSHCPVCQTPLGPGMNIRSKIFTSAASENDKLCYVYGCPACFPEAKPGVKRECPVCHKPLPSDSYLASRIFYKTKSGKPHVIINGCPFCNKH